ncbi:hypothetical protein [Psychromonas aquimarina]|uniref:hypothetical protein n=1 Tax=Psychromonas aquimarina TaxID=444919 RepID=UPI00048CC7A8|nr:hypothetical protein [Psychromonas aquimarina]
MAFGLPAQFQDSYSFDNTDFDIRSTVNRAIKITGWKVKNDSSESISLSSGLNALSWGEDINIQFTANNSILVTSKCVFPLQCFDWGKNKGNVNKLLNILRKNV